MLISRQSRTNQDPVFFEENWTAPLNYFSSETSITGLQCFILAQIYCMTKRDYRSLLRYRALAVDICHQLGLYQNEKDAAFNPLEGETRKKVFWCQYVLDRYDLFLRRDSELLANSSIGSVQFSLECLFS